MTSIEDEHDRSPLHPVFAAHACFGLHPKSHVRMLPSSLHLEERLRWEAIVFACDSIAHSYIRLVELGVKVGSPALLPGERIGLFQHAWTIIDEVHQLRQLLPGTGFAIPELIEFVGQFEAATLLRNRRDHVDKQLSNLASRKGFHSGLNGSLSFVLFRKDDIDMTPTGPVPKSGFFVMLQSGPVAPNEQVGSIRVPERYALPIGNFVLHAFDRDFDLDELVRGLSKLVPRLDKEVGLRLEKSISAAAAESGRSPEELRKHRGGGLTMMLKFNLAANETGVSPNVEVMSKSTK